MLPALAAAGRAAVGIAGKQAARGGMLRAATQGSQNTEVHYHIEFPLAVVMVGVAIIFDMAQVAFALISPVVTIAAGFAFWLWFLLLGEKYSDRFFGQRLMIWMSMFIVELVPLVGAFIPSITGGVVSLIVLSRYKDRQRANGKEGQQNLKMLGKLQKDDRQGRTRAYNAKALTQFANSYQQSVRNDQRFIEDSADAHQRMMGYGDDGQEYTGEGGRRRAERQQGWKKSDYRRETGIATSQRDFDIRRRETDKGANTPFERDRGPRQARAFEPNQGPDDGA